MTALLRMLALALTIFVPLTALAQDQANSAAQDQAKPAAASSDQLLKPEQLDALVAPIALYPDNLLSLVLMASTYPLELVQADRWMKENKKIKGDELKVEVNKQAWDENVKALVATPDVLAMMSTKLDWTVKLGDAVLAQQPDVMDAIQRLRSRADANNKLSSTNEQKVVKQQQQGKQIISIEPTNPNTVYVPYYDPAVVYGGWPYPAYPPYYFGYPGYIPGGLIATGLAFGAGYAMGRWASGGNYWGGGFNWNNNNININRPQVNPLGGNNWQHRPEHRQGVRYDNPRVQQRFGSNNIGNGAQNRMDFRGRGGDQVLRPGGGEQRPGAGQRPGGAQRPSAGPKTFRREIPARRNGLREPEPNPASDPLADSGMQERGHRVDQAAATRLEISDLAKRPIGRPHAATQAWAAVPAAAALRAPAVVLEVVVEAVVRVAAAVVVEVAEEAGVPTSRSSMTSCYLAISPMALAITNLATTAAIARTSA